MLVVRDLIRCETALSGGDAQRCVREEMRYV